MEIEDLFRYPALAVGLMAIEKLFRYPALAVGLKPRLDKAKPACAGYGGIITQRP